MKDGDKLLFLKRSTEWRFGKFCLPTGHVEAGESIRHAARRELKEETNLDVDISDLEFIHVVHRAPEDNEDAEYVDFYFIAHNVRGEAINAEADKHSEIAWLDIDNTDSDVFIDTVLSTLRAIKKNKPYSEIGWE